MTDVLTPADLAYAAALIDQFGRITTRTLPTGVDLPEVAIQGRVQALDWLAGITGTKVVEIPKAYNKHQCSEHCPQRHARVESTSRRWVVTGARATIVLYSVQPFLRVQGIVARNVAWMGMRVGYKPATARDMANRGWTVPDLGSAPSSLSAATGRISA